MADKPLFNLDAEGRWRLAYDARQWVVQRRAGEPCWRGSDSAAMRRSGWRAVSFIGSTKTTLRRVLDERGVALAVEAQAQLDALPERFLAFLAEIDSPQPDNARTARSRFPDGPERQPGQQRPSTSVFGARASKAA